MSKKQHNYYYSITSPPSEATSSNTSQAPLIDTAQDDNTNLISPPAYDEAIATPDSTPLQHSTSPKPSTKKSGFFGHVRDKSIPLFNPTSPSSSAAAEASAPLVIDMDRQQTYSDDSNIFTNTGDHDVNEPLINTDQQQVILRDSFQGRPPPPNYSVYHAHYQTKKSGILSRDPHLNQDGEALAQFLQQQNNPPLMKIKFYGYHEETHFRTRSVTDDEGNRREEQEPVTRKVDDFNFGIDCSDDVFPQCQGLYVLPDPDTGHIKTVRQLCDDYVHEINTLKELRLTKVIKWNYAELTRALTSAIRAHGYHHSVEISYEINNHKITVKTDSAISKLSDHKAVRFLFFLTCLWIFAWPLLWLFKKKFGHSTLKSEWLMKKTERQWYDDHVHEVLGQIDSTPHFGNVPFLL
ncbi:hypothetical protein BC941DRAFT_434606 [Chlamydoabsidia padenii]|nr:hypothetical protein BC941DRAFT_434606 [Chlamydoabsidia padenii]